MSNFRIEGKESFRIVGFKAALAGSDSIHAPGFSNQKTEFFKRIIQDGQMALVRPLAEDPYGYGAVSAEEGNIFYYAGIRTSQPALDRTEEVLFPDGDYLIIEGSGGLSRLAFDRLEDQAFNDILRDDYEWEYAGTPVAEVLLNGNPSDAQVEIWVPVKRRTAV